MSEALKLKATDAEDFAVIAAVLQDALLPLADMKYLVQEQRFVLVANRFKWENCGPAGEADPPRLPSGLSEGDPAEVACESFERTNCGLCFEGVVHVRRKELDQQDRGRILALLHIEAEPEAVVMLFAGGAALRLEGPHITCRVADIGEPWPTLWRPGHPPAETA
ncbi:MAG: DUF2948 family protein [Pseudomonadota bacterium]